ncbi:hypothetical protein HBI56_182240 [Parastagonospora nodorum]|uniref:Uncharacterized protein n=1 Tax=Phaeosphaeria nodorum (strain SN15 / ATCC MYA-4574 / FGSC 10173) TaxID=321614 RepID=A0A7U2I2I9_PHANO|nr:hypothetical protein HBH56_187650 [Parastagonospora nodorum]QRD00951.1 hypothetical protein JI435_164710 [Parastagonospora nodorum SN15]KAH3925400.1 hypothetical protein HBH54_180910 [Parastagonospora nodorum]KAH3959150.1 hypothetical protein HBH52_246170 [Parastagonospora nodorum]KAH3991038.1 hypothetical protein HBI10_238910 [Parastagonospora nodorum]
MMTVENKRKSRSSMSPQSSTQPKRRPSVRSRADVTTPGTIPQCPTTSPVFSAQNPRPARWRKSHAEARPPVLDSPVLKSIYRSPSQEPEPVPRYGLRSRQQQQPQERQRQEGIELRFSFSHPADEEDPTPEVGLRRNVFREAQEARTSIEDPEVVNRSFSNLSVNQDAVTKVSPYRARSVTPTNGPRPRVPYESKAKATAVWAHQTSQQRRSRSPQSEPVATIRMPTIPELSKPKRGGYGFSYSDSNFYDSDEYPDTEVGSETNFTPEENSASTPDPTFPNPSFEEATVKNSSFGEDLVVVREVGSFHYARPQRRLPCTTATCEDTLRLKVAAKNLLKYKESQDVYGALVGRVERMVQNTLKDNGGDTSAAMLLCASKLLNFLQRMAVERLEHGEPATLVTHEIHWAKWLVEASHTGVMHLKGVGCECQPDWEE